ncbi:hypothetical protein T10_2818 [Trichinella papuae]|uniref:Uncharacterized protein n=1 Tax=Trichinella papuae TaxID=268474 RepID=A0A0V1MQR3_9BILA|nr:hypothetical protein T10_2818 [Trichinella papuae]
MKNKFGNIDNFLIEYQYGYQYRIKTYERFLCFRRMVYIYNRNADVLRERRTSIKRKFSVEF